MRIQSILLLLVCFLLSGLTLPAIACPPPDCGSCCHWEGPVPGGSCELNTGVECGDCHGCYNPCYSCVSCFCEWDCSTGATCCNGSCCNSDNCCNGTTCCTNSNDVCCTDSGSYCCESGETCCKGTCCDPNLCLDCNSTTGQCESICDPNCEFCCDGTCCKNWQCCVDSNCVDPICEDCHEVNDTLIECGHKKDDTWCQSDWCIENILLTASCDYKGDDWPCKKSRCNTTVDAGWAVWQTFRAKSCSGGGLVIYSDWQVVWHGCDTCNDYHIRSACETSGGYTCDFPARFLGSDYRGTKHKCGGCDYGGCD